MRISGSAGFAGGWKSTTPLQAMPSVLLLTLSDHKLHYAFPEKSQYSDLTLDGSDAAVNGPGVTPGSTMAMKYSKPQGSLVTKKLNGQIVNLGILRISTDGHTLTETYWRPQNPEESCDRIRKTIGRVPRQNAIRRRNGPESETRRMLWQEFSAETWPWGDREAR